MKSTLLFSKWSLLLTLGYGWLEKIAAFEGVSKGIYSMCQTNFLTAWLCQFGPDFPMYFLGQVELLAFLLLLLKEKWGALLSCLIFMVTLSFMKNGFDFFLFKDLALLGISLDLARKYRYF